MNTQKLMKTVELHKGCIDFIFANCECITVDMWAIKYFHFDVKEERWIWDKDHKNFLKTNQVDDFNLVLDVSYPKHFSHKSEQEYTTSLDWYRNVRILIHCFCQ